MTSSNMANNTMTPRPDSETLGINPCPTIADVILSIANSSLDSDTPLLECHLLLTASLGRPKSWLIAHDDYRLSESEFKTYSDLLARRIDNEPIAYILGSQGFWDMDLTVTQDTLIPRPETELLIEIILSTHGTEPHRAIDLGTGTGAIAIALKRERPEWQVYASDLSPKALSIAKTNAIKWTNNQIGFLRSNWLNGFGPKEFDLIVSNPPYINEIDEHLQALEFEPRSALVASDEGYSDFKTIIDQAVHCLKFGGKLLLEHGYDQRDSVTELLNNRGYSDIQVFDDYNNTPRAVMACWTP